MLPRFYGNAGGGPERNNLEPDALADSLDQLLDWGHVLGADPEMVRTLAGIKAAASDGELDAAGSEEAVVARGPDVREPSP
ncbi:MAG: hypothetical protein AAF619_03520 [Pseudomonadota bacterium]